METNGPALALDPQLWAKSAIATMNEGLLRRRYILFHIEKEAIFALFKAWKPSFDAMALPKIKDVPDDAEIQVVWYDNAADCFVFRVHHLSFPEIPIGERPDYRPMEVEGVLFKRDPKTQEYERGS